MALLGKFDSSYTSTGNGGLTGFATKLSLIPGINLLTPTFLKKIPIVGGLLTAFIGYIDTAIEAVGWLIKGKPLSAMTVAAAGAVSNTLNATPALWWVNDLSGVATGRTIGTHGRKLTESVIGGVTGMLGIKPTVLQSYPVGIGSIGGGAAPAGPGKFASQISAERGRNANEMYDQYQRGEGGVHLNELQSANMGRA